ncbi:MAG: glycosyltransferase [Eubacteriales bacterium]
MKKTKVMQFIFGLSTGGAETLVKDYAMMSPEDIESVIVIISDENTQKNVQTLKNKGISVISIRRNIKLKKLYNIWKRILFRYMPNLHRKACAKELSKIIRSEKPDCIHIHLEMLHYLEAIILELEGIKLFYTCHNLPSRMFTPREKKIATILIKQYNMKLIALHDEMKEELNELFSVTNTLTLHNGIDFDKFQEQKTSKSDARRKLNVSTDRYIVGHVGRFQEQKNHDFLIDIFHEVVLRKHEAFLLMVGMGELKDKMITKLEGLGLGGKYLCLENRDDIPLIMKAMDVFVFPSKWEGFGNVLIEAQVSGLRCVISNTIPESVMLSEQIVGVDLDEEAGRWADIVLDNTILNKKIYGDIGQHDMKNVINRLVEEYRGKTISN